MYLIVFLPPSLFGHYSQEAANVLKKSGLEGTVLKRIWDLSDTDGDSKLNIAEFTLAMHFAVGCSKRGLRLPNELPVSLAAAVGARVKPPSSSSLTAAKQQGAVSFPQVGVGVPQSLLSATAVFSPPPAPDADLRRAINCRPPHCCQTTAW